MADIIDFGAYRDPADMNKAELLAYLETLRRQPGCHRGRD